jgi:hypothetical protein
MIFLGDRGWDCTGLDNWAAAVKRVRTAAKDFDLPNMRAHHINLGEDGCMHALHGLAGQSDQCPHTGSELIRGLQQSQYALVMNVRFLNRGLVPQLRQWTATGGFLLFSTFLDDPHADDEVRRVLFLLMFPAVGQSLDNHFGQKLENTWLLIICTPQPPT